MTPSGDTNKSLNETDYVEVFLSDKKIASVKKGETVELHNLLDGGCYVVQFLSA